MGAAVNVTILLQWWFVEFMLQECWLSAVVF